LLPGAHFGAQTRITYCHSKKRVAKKGSKKGVEPNKFLSVNSVRPLLFQAATMHGVRKGLTISPDTFPLQFLAM